MNRLASIDTPIQGLSIVERQRMSDDRGYFSRLFSVDELASTGWCKPIVQINQSCTLQQGTIRGLHFQHSPYAEMKLVTCLHGAVWDVAVDLRVRSPTFLRWHAVELSAENRRALLIPEGFAHGLQTLTNDCELLYLHSAVYSPQAEDGINPKDPTLGITWPLPISKISARDIGLPVLDGGFVGVSL